MIKYNNSIISKIWILFLTIGIALLVIRFWPIADKKTQESSHYQENYAQLALVLTKTWKNGGSDHFKNPCKSYKFNELLVHSDFKSCNSDYFKCLFDENKNIKINNTSYKTLSLKLDNRFNPIVSLSSGEAIFHIKLFNSCRDVYLPQKFYSAGVKGKDHLWDNFDQNVYIDKNYISNREVKLWNKKEIGADYIPNTSLDLDDKRKYCSSIGKQLLESRYLDAASFFPENKERFFYKHPYPWTKERSLKKDSILKRDCSNIYSKECESIRPYQFFEPISLTWMGIANALGAYPEIVLNKFDKDLNRVPSSFYYEWNHKYHQVGFRIKNDDQNENSGAFRCMSIF